MSTTNTIKLLSKDGEECTISSKVARLSGTVNRLLETLEVTEENNAEPIPLPNVDATILRLVIQWAEQHVEDDVPPPPPSSEAYNEAGSRQLGTLSTITICQWDADFFTANNSSVLGLINAANYLEILPLMYGATSWAIDAAIKADEDDVKSTTQIPFTAADMAASLPDVPLLATLTRQPTERLLKASHLCPKFTELCSQIARQRTQLNLIIGDYLAPHRKLSLWPLFRRRWDGKILDLTTTSPSDDSDEFAITTTRWMPALTNLIQVPSGNHIPVKLLPTTIQNATQFFHNITSLVIGLFAYSHDELYRIIPLLEAYAHQLITFKLYENSRREGHNWQPPRIYDREYRESIRVHSQLLEVINAKLTKLQCLTLHCKAAFLTPAYSIKLSVLAQLDEFRFHALGEIRDFAAELRKQLEKNLQRSEQRHRPLRLSLLPRDPIDNFWKYFPANDDDLADHLLEPIRHICLHVDQLFLQNIHRLVNLTILHVHFINKMQFTTWRQFLASLIPLRALEEFHLHEVNFSKLESIATGAAAADALQEPIVLPTVRYLFLQFNMWWDESRFTNHRLLEEMRIDVSLPRLRKANIEVRYLSTDSCVRCTTTNPLILDQPSCRSKLVFPLKRCPKIHEIFIGKQMGYRRIGSTEEFEAFGFLQPNPMLPEGHERAYAEFISSLNTQYTQLYYQNNK